MSLCIPFHYMSSIGLILDIRRTCIIMYYVCVYFLSTDVVLKSGTLDRRTYKGKAQLCKSVERQPALLDTL